MKTKKHTLINQFLVSTTFLIFLFACEKDDEKINFTYGSMTDVEGNVYNTIDIGNQTWMAENLRTTKYNDGTNIPLVLDDSEWKYMKSPAYCWFENDKDSYSIDFGALYNWYTINTKKLCPTGWRVPSEEDWNKLILYAGGEDIAGGKLKATTHWRSPNIGATNETGFTALPMGIRYSGGYFHQIEYLGGGATWWSATELSQTHAKLFHLNYSGSHLFNNRDSKAGGYAIRCIKD